MNIDSFLSFLLKYYGVADTGNTPENKGQCVGLISVWMDTLGIAHEFGNAKDLLTNADTSKFDVIQNTPDGFPTCGDILVYGASWGGGYGHTGVVVTADANHILLFEQNNPGAPTIKLEGYNDCLGWLHPKNFNIDNQSIIDGLRVERDDNYNKFVAEQAKNTDLTKQLQDSQTQTQNLRDAFDLQTKADANTGSELLTAQHNLTSANDLLISVGKLVNMPLSVPVSLTDSVKLQKAIADLQQPHSEVAAQVVPTMEQLFANVQKNNIKGFGDWLKLGWNLFIHK